MRRGIEWWVRQARALLTVPAGYVDESEGHPAAWAISAQVPPLTPEQQADALLRPFASIAIGTEDIDKSAAARDWVLYAQYTTPDTADFSWTALDAIGLGAVSNLAPLAVELSWGRGGVFVGGSFPVPRCGLAIGLTADVVRGAVLRARGTIEENRLNVTIVRGRPQTRYQSFALIGPDDARDLPVAPFATGLRGFGTQESSNVIQLDAFGTQLGTNQPARDIGGLHPLCARVQASVSQEIVGAWEVCQ